MKAVVLAGGSGSRLAPVTGPINKHFLPIYNKPMIYYPLSMVMLCGIREVMLVVNPGDLDKFRALLGNGEELGMRIEYVIQPFPRGLAEGLILSEQFLKGESVCYVLGDNIFFGHDLTYILKEAMADIEENGGAYVFGYNVKDPWRFGVVEFDSEGRVISIEEKPRSPKSNFAVVGLYFYDSMAVEYAKEACPSDRGEIEITSVNNRYLKEGRLKVKLLGRGFAWFDAGTHNSLLEAGEFVATIENKTGLMIGCIEEIAFNNGWIDIEQLKRLAGRLSGTFYGDYLWERIRRIDAGN